MPCLPPPCITTTSAAGSVSGRCADKNYIVQFFDYKTKFTKSYEQLPSANVQVDDAGCYASVNDDCGNARQQAVMDRQRSAQHAEQIDRLR